MQLALGKISWDQNNISSKAYKSQKAKQPDSGDTSLPNLLVHALALCGLSSKHKHRLVSQLWAGHTLYEAEFSPVHHSFLKVIQGKILVLPQFGTGPIT